MADVVLWTGVVAAVVGAIRATWSPCGESMLSSITPLGERGRNNRFAVAASFFIAGSLLGGAAIGGVAGALWRAVLPAEPAPAAAPVPAPPPAGAAFPAPVCARPPAPATP